LKVESAKLAAFLIFKKYRSAPKCMYSDWIQYTWSNGRLTENVYLTVFQLTLNLTSTLTQARTLALTLKHKTFFGRTIWRHF